LISSTMGWKNKFVLRGKSSKSPEKNVHTAPVSPHPISPDVSAAVSAAVRAAESAEASPPIDRKPVESFFPCGDDEKSVGVSPSISVDTPNPLCVNALQYYDEAAQYYDEAACCNAEGTLLEACTVLFSHLQSLSNNTPNTDINESEAAATDDAFTLKNGTATAPVSTGDVNSQSTEPIPAAQDSVCSPPESLSELRDADQEAPSAAVILAPANTQPTLLIPKESCTSDEEEAGTDAVPPRDAEAATLVSTKGAHSQCADPISAAHDSVCSLPNSPPMLHDINGEAAAPTGGETSAPVSPEDANSRPAKFTLVPPRDSSYSPLKWCESNIFDTEAETADELVPPISQEDKKYIYGWQPHGFSELVQPPLRNKNISRSLNNREKHEGKEKYYKTKMF